MQRGVLFLCTIQGLNLCFIIHLNEVGVFSAFFSWSGQKAKAGTYLQACGCTLKLHIKRVCLGLCGKDLETWLKAQDTCHCLSLQTGKCLSHQNSTLVGLKTKIRLKLSHFYTPYKPVLFNFAAIVTHTMIYQ